MKDNETRRRFVELRAAGKSYREIAATLGMNKDTCVSLERDLRKQIAATRNDELDELQERYFVTRAARMRKLGESLARIEAALESVDLATLPPEKLLDMKLKYLAMLKREYVDTAPSKTLSESMMDFEL